MKNLHPAFDVFMQWREDEMVKENIEAERRWALMHGDHCCFWDHIQYVKDGGMCIPNPENLQYYSRVLYDEPFDRACCSVNEGSNICCNKCSLRILEKTKNYKKRAHAIRWLQRKEEIQKDAKAAYSSCGDVEDDIGEHLESLYQSVHLNPVNYGYSHYDDIFHLWDFVLPKKGDIVGRKRRRRRHHVVLYSDMIAKHPSYFPGLAMVERSEKERYDDCKSDTVEFSSKFLITHQNLPIP